MKTKLFGFLLILCFTAINMQIYAIDAGAKTNNVTLFDENLDCVLLCHEGWSLMGISKSITEETIQKYGYDFKGVKEAFENKELNKYFYGYGDFPDDFGEIKRLGVLFFQVLINAYNEQNGLEPVYVTREGGAPGRVLPNSFDDLKTNPNIRNTEVLDLQWNNNGYFFLNHETNGLTKTYIFYDVWGRYFITNFYQKFVSSAVAQNIPKEEINSRYKEYISRYKPQKSNPDFLFDKAVVRLGRFTKN